MNYTFDISIEVPPYKQAIISLFAIDEYSNYQLITRAYSRPNFTEKIYLFSDSLELSENCDYFELNYRDV